MPFPATAVGVELETFERDLDVRSVLAYAAGVGASEPAFLDDARAGGLVALPFLCVSLEWPVVLSLRRALAGLTPEEGRQGVHAAQDSIFHRPMRPGDTLATRGKLVAVRRARAGVLTVMRLDTICRRTGEPVVTSWSTSIYRDVSLDGEDKSLAEPPADPVAAALPPDAEACAIPIPREAPHVYSECAAIWNPIHTERAVALAAGLPDIILHGTATWALAGLEVLRRYAGSHPARLKRISGRFTGMVIPGETITVRHAPAGEGVVRFEVVTSSGATAIREGFAFLASQ